MYIHLAMNLIIEQGGSTVSKAKDFRFVSTFPNLKQSTKGSLGSSHASPQQMPKRSDASCRPFLTK